MATVLGAYKSETKAREALASSARFGIQQGPDATLRERTHLRGRPQKQEDTGPASADEHARRCGDSSASLDDSVLVKRAQDGDKSAIDDLFRRHRSRAYNYTRRLTSNDDEAGDIVSEAFIKISRAIPNFRFRCAFTTWLYLILNHCFVDARIKATSHPTLSIDSIAVFNDHEFELPIEDPRPSPHEELEHQIALKALEEAFLDLPDDQRELIALRHERMLSYLEISETLNKPIGTVKSRLNRARRSLVEHAGIS